VSEAEALRRQLLRALDVELRRLEAADPAERNPGDLGMLWNALQSLRRVSGGDA
jgi:hypothetical protein